MKVSGIWAAVIQHIDPPVARRRSPRADGGAPRRARLRAAAAVTALLGLGALTAGCPLCDGNDIGCEDSVGISGPIGLAADAPAHLTIEACWKQRCGTVTLSSDVPRPLHPPLGANAAVEGGRFRCELADLDPTNTHWEIRITFIPDPNTDLEDGEVYKVRVVDDDTQRELVSLERSVTYEDVYPGKEGAFCKSCAHAQIEIPPPAAE
ncbi:hypothetical protein WME89_25265 [Sorangium sp. So ce321]|uniref:hypothetical protein n=1 Tax=Sorangium sp. So ce321 TaxID=3133300 RepID=UPI003F5D7821